MRRPRAWLVGGFAAIVLLGWLIALGSYATRDRNVVTSNPGLTPFTSVVPVALDPGEEACVSPTPLEARTGRASFLVIAKPAKREVPPLELTVSGRGYRATTTVRDYPATDTPTGVQAEFEPPGRALLGEVCWRNAGTRRVNLVGTDEAKSAGPAITTVDGAEQPADVTLALSEREPRSLADRPGQLADRVSAISGLPQVVLWPLLLVVLLGFPLGAAFALWRTDDEDEPAPPPPADPDQLPPPAA